MKKLITIAILLGLLSTIALADDLAGDCNLIVETYQKENMFSLIKSERIPGKLKDIPTESIIDQAAIATAFLNLKKVCCNNDEFKKKTDSYKTCQTDQPNFNDNVPDSTYLFDHLLDVIIRRLDGDENSIYKNTSLDPKGKERREKINETATRVQGSTPAQISKQYQEYWKKSGGGQNIVENISKIVSDTNTSSPRKIVETMTNEKNSAIWKNYSNRSLLERYENVCNIAGYLYFLFVPEHENYKQSISATREKILKQECASLIEQRIENEVVYVNVVQTKRSNDLLVENINQYTNVYLNKRLMDLQSTIENIKAKLLRVTRAIEGIVKVCK